MTSIPESELSIAASALVTADQALKIQREGFRSEGIPYTREEFATTSKNKFDALLKLSRLFKAHPDTESVFRRDFPKAYSILEEVKQRFKDDGILDDDE